MVTTDFGFEVNPLGETIGAEIVGLDLKQTLSDAAFAEIEETFYRYSVVALRDQDLSTAELIAFSRRFGTLQVNARTKTKTRDSEMRIQPDEPEAIYISNITVNGKVMGSNDAGRYWHSDLCYEKTPSKVTLLHALEVPQKGGIVYGATKFADVGLAYDALSAELKARLKEYQAGNSFRHMWQRKAGDFGTRVFLNEEELAKLPPDAIHPVVRAHPKTGRDCLYVCDGYTNRILDLPEAESDRLLGELFAHIVKREFRYQHEWRQGDLLMWDNCAVQHKASFDYEPTLRRLMQRCTVMGDAIV
jgi:taurine dioxygenase